LRICYWTSNAVGGAGKYELYLPRCVSKLHVDVNVYKRPKGFFGNPILLKLFYKTNGDIVHATTQTLSIYANPKPRRFIVTVHDMLTLHRSMQSKVKRFLIKKFLNKADKIIAVSEFTKREILNQTNVPEDNIEIVPMGVDISRYRPLNKNYSRSIFNLDLGCKYILVVASNASYKRTDIALAVFNEIKKYRDDVKLIKAGYGQQLQGEGIINVGFVPESKMPYLYNASDVLLHTSEYEGFGMPILEAMACGIPVVCSKKASIPEVVGSRKYLVDIDSTDCIKQFAWKILDNLERKRDLKFVMRARNFSWDNIAKRTVKIYERVYDSIHASRE